MCVVVMFYKVCLTDSDETGFFDYLHFSDRADFFEYFSENLCCFQKFFGSGLGFAGGFAVESCNGDDSSETAVLLNINSDFVWVDFN